MISLGIVIEVTRCLSLRGDEDGDCMVTRCLGIRTVMRWTKRLRDGESG